VASVVQSDFCDATQTVFLCDVWGGGERERERDGGRLRDGCDKLVGRGRSRSRGRAVGGGVQEAGPESFVLVFGCLSPGSGEEIAATSE